MILHECEYSVDFINRVEDKRLNARLAEHLNIFLQQV